MSDKSKKIMDIIILADLVIALLFLLTLVNPADNSINPEALLGAGVFVLLAGITHHQKFKWEKPKD